MKKMRINRIKAKIRQYKIQKTKAKAEMVNGDLNEYIKDLISLYDTKKKLQQVTVTVQK